MTVEVVNLETPPSSAFEVVALLEELLSRAREGEFSACAVALTTRDMATVTRWTASPSFATLLGAVSYLTWRMNELFAETP